MFGTQDYTSRVVLRNVHDVLKKHVRWGIEASALNRYQNDQNNVKSDALLFGHLRLISCGLLVWRRLYAKDDGHDEEAGVHQDESANVTLPEINSKCNQAERIYQLHLEDENTVPTNMKNHANKF